MRMTGGVRSIKFDWIFVRTYPEILLALSPLYINEVLTNMTLGGVSDKQEIKALIEIKEAHRKYGCYKYVRMFWLVLTARVIKKIARIYSALN